MTSHLSIPVKHVSETAYLVAVYRSIASKKPGALFNDKLADILVGEERERLLKKIPFSDFGEWMMVVRTAVLDKLILENVRAGVTTIINLAAGLDTRPYRLDLPKTVNWVEMDLPGIINYKNQKLAAHQPTCQLQRMSVDLSVDEERRTALSNVNANADRSLVITEGLLIYLNEDNVVNLAHDLHALTSVEAWLLDVTGPTFMEWALKLWDLSAPSTERVEFKFLLDDPRGFFRNLGWSMASFESFIDASRAIAAPTPMLDGALLSSLKDPKDSGIAMLRKAND